MFFLLTLLLNYGTAAPAAEVEWLNMPKATPVYVRPRANAPLLIMTREGEKVAVRLRGNVFTRVQVKRGGVWKTGYVRSVDLDSPEVSTPRGNFGFGAGGMYSYLRHSPKRFETEDEVQYETDEFVSGAFSPFITIQYGGQDFWRLILAYRRTDFSSSAVTDLPGAQPRELTLEHTMISGSIQKMWTPFGTPIFYYGLGLEASKATDANLVLGGLKLPVAAEDLPTYLGGHVALGGQLNLGRSLSAFGELRLGGFFNQSPIIMSAETVFGLLYWP